MEINRTILTSRRVPDVGQPSPDEHSVINGCPLIYKWLTWSSLDEDGGTNLVDGAVGAPHHVRPEDKAKVARDECLDDQADNATGCAQKMSTWN